MIKPTRVLLESDEFKKHVKAGTVDADALVCKGFASQIVKADDTNDLTLTFKISDASVDRDDDTIAVEGWDLANFVKSGSMIWAHDPCQPPIAGPRATWVQDSALWSKTEFLPQDVSAFSYMIYQMYLRDVLRGVSVGFKPKQYTFNEGRGAFAIDFIAQELLEFSATPVPSNPNAVMAAKSIGIDVAPLVTWCERVLDERQQIKGATSAQVERTLRDVKPSVSVQVPSAKAGRSLSKANEDKLRMAHSHIADVLESVAPEPVDDENSTTGAGQRSAVLERQKVDAKTNPPVQSDSKKIDAPADPAVALLVGILSRHR